MVTYATFLGTFTQSQQSDILMHLFHISYLFVATLLHSLLKNVN